MTAGKSSKRALAGDKYVELVVRQQRSSANAMRRRVSQRARWTRATLPTCDDFSVSRRE